MSFINGNFIEAEKHSTDLFVIKYNLPLRTHGAATEYSSECAVDWISASNESNLSGKACAKQEFL